MKIISILLVGLLVVAVGACSSMQKFDHSTEYQKVAAEAQPIVVPKGLSSSKIETYYRIPATGKNAPTKPVSIIPPGSNLDKPARN